MKCTDFNKELCVIHAKEIDELTQSLLAHGGRYEFADGEETDMDDLENYPEVVAQYEYEWINFQVMEVSLDEEGDPYISGKARTESGACYVDEYICSIPAGDVMVGDMKYIISKMDEPEEKKGVSIHQVIADIAINVGWERLDVVDSREMVNLIIKWANEFEQLHRNTDWSERGDYIDAIDNFSQEKIKKLMK